MRIVFIYNPECTLYFYNIEIHNHIHKHNQSMQETITYHQHNLVHLRNHQTFKIMMYTHTRVSKYPQLLA